MPTGQLASLAFDVELDGKAGFPELAHENRDVGEARLGRERFVRVATEHAEQTTHLGQRAATRLLDCLQHLAGRGVCVVENAPLGSGLEDDHRDVMGDHVVQLASDSSPLFDDRLARDEIPFALRYLHPSLPVANDATHEQHHDERDHGERHASFRFASYRNCHERGQRRSPSRRSQTAAASSRPSARRASRAKRRRSSRCWAASMRSRRCRRVRAAAIPAAAGCRRRTATVLGHQRPGDRDYEPFLSAGAAEPGLELRRNGEDHR